MIKAGQKVRIIGDTFTQDPHLLEIGSVYEVHSISPATEFKDFPPLLQFIFAVEGIEPHDLPERVHVKTGDGEMDFANIVLEDVEVIDGIKRVRMLEDDFFDGYSEGDEFDVLFDEEGDGFFHDHDGDVRFLVDHEHEIIQ
jgi:hypothetical protein